MSVNKVVNLVISKVRNIKRQHAVLCVRVGRDGAVTE